jgi:cohesin complex subunit SCC1
MFNGSLTLAGEKCHATVVIQSVENQISELNLPGEIQADGGKQDEQPDNTFPSDNQLENLNSSLTSELPTPEKLLSVPQGLLDKPNDLLVESTPVEEIVDGGDRSSAGTNITGKKRSFTESSLTVQSLNSVDSFGVSRSKRTVDSIPDDDDLLSSILGIWFLMPLRMPCCDMTQSCAYITRKKVHWTCFEKR